MDDLIERLENLSTPERRKHGVHADLAMYDAATALRAFAEREKELVEALTDIERDTERSALLVGFAHSAPTRQELQDRLDAIQACARAVLSKHKEQK